MLMNKIKVPVFIILFCAGTWSSIAQNVEFSNKNFPGRKSELKSALKEIKEGDSYADPEVGMYPAALSHYMTAYEFNSENALLNYKIGLSKMHTPGKHDAKPYIEKALLLDSLVSPDIHYLLGQCHHLENRFDLAIREFNRYKTLLKKEKKPDPQLKKEVEKKIRECETGKQMISNPVNVTIENLSKIVNSVFPDYKPVINADESILIFTSRRNTSLGGNKDEQDNQYYEDIYISHFNKGEWSVPDNPGAPLNSDLHDAAMGLSPDGQRMLVYKGDNGGDIYESKLSGDNWTEPLTLGKNINTEFHESSASYSFDGRTIYFVSDRPGGYGGKDIFVVKADKKGKWGLPKNLGKTINTAYDEVGVFMHPDGKTLYFSSKGHKTMGGYDVFKSVFQNNLWSEPVNIGYPINTADDDVFFSISGSGIHAYYSSAKNEGFGGQDIYRITFNDLLAPVKKDSAVVVKKEDVKTNQLTILKGVVMDEKTLSPVNAKIELTDNSKNEIIATFESNSKTGKYLVSLPSGVNYGIAIDAPGYLFHSENFDIPASTEYREISKDIYLKKVEVGNVIILNNIFFDFDKSSLRPESSAELDRLVTLMKQNPALTIEISGHTDNVGTAVYNKKLSENRAKAVVDYLVSRGITQARLQFAGYGFDKPIAPNDTEEGRQQNRRTEFKIIKK